MRPTMTMRGMIVGWSDNDHDQGNLARDRKVKERPSCRGVGSVDSCLKNYWYVTLSVFNVWKCFKVQKSSYC